MAAVRDRPPRLPARPRRCLRLPIAGEFRGLLGHLEFAEVRAPRQILDRLAVLVARGEIERSDVRALPEQRVDAADVLEPFGPVDVVDEAQAPDDVAGGDVAGGQRVMLADDDLFGVAAGFLQLLLEPVQRLAGILRAVAQPVEKLRCEGRVARMRRIVGEDLCGRRRRRASPARGRRPRWRSGASGARGSRGPRCA